MHARNVTAPQLARHRSTPTGSAPHDLILAVLRQAHKDAQRGDLGAAAFLDDQIPNWQTIAPGLHRRQFAARRNNFSQETITP